MYCSTRGERKLAQHRSSAPAPNHRSDLAVSHKATATQEAQRGNYPPLSTWSHGRACGDSTVRERQLHAGSKYRQSKCKYCNTMSVYKHKPYHTRTKVKYDIYVHTIRKQQTGQTKNIRASKAHLKPKHHAERASYWVFVLFITSVYIFIRHRRSEPSVEGKRTSIFALRQHAQWRLLGQNMHTGAAPHATAAFEAIQRSAGWTVSAGSHHRTNRLVLL